MFLLLLWILMIFSIKDANQVKPTQRLLQATRRDFVHSRNPRCSEPPEDEPAETHGQFLLA